MEDISMTSVSYGSNIRDEDILKRLKRAEGQVRGIIRLLENKVHCTEILTQIAAVRSALRQASLKILKRHVETCVSDAIRGNDDGGAKSIDELIKVLDRYGI